MGKISNFILAIIIYLTICQGLNAQNSLDSTHVYKNGKLLYIEFRDAQGLEVIGVTNWRKHYEFNENGNITKKYYTDLNNVLIPNIKCSAPMTVYRYDSENRLIESTYYDEKGDPMLHSCELVHRRVLNYDSISRQINECYYWVDGSLKGVVEFEYLERSKQPFLISFLDSYNRSIGSVEIEYDELGREINQIFLDANGHLRNGENVVAAKKTEYFNEGKKVTLLNPLGKVLKEDIFESSLAENE